MFPRIDSTPNPDEVAWPLAACYRLAAQRGREIRRASERGLPGQSCPTCGKPGHCGCFLASPTADAGRAETEKHPEAITGE